MAALPPIRKFYIEDYPSQKAWIGPFLLILNSFVENVVNAINNNLTLVQNTTSDIKEITLNVVPTVSAPSGISWTKAMPPKAVIIGNIVGVSDTLTLSAAVSIQWSMSADLKSLYITNIVGVTPTDAAKIKLTLVCIVG